MSDLYIVSHSPHIKSRLSTITFQLITIAALVCLSGWGVFAFGLNALYIILATTISALFVEIIYNLISYKKFVLKDYSSIVVGLSIGLTMPPLLPFYYAIVGSLLSMILIKLACGGLGKNFVSEVAFGKVIVALIFGSVFSGAFAEFGGEAELVTLTGATKLGVEKNITVLDLLLGKTTGAIGETSIALILILGIVLCLTRAIDWKVPFFYLLTVAILGLFVVDISLFLQFLASGGIVFVAVFVASDFGSLPNTGMGRILFSIFCGLLTIIIWEFGNYALAPYFAVLIGELVFSAFSDFFKPKFDGYLGGK